MRVIAPASSANIGPGFDTLGLALDLPFELVVDPPEGPSAVAVAAAAAAGERPLLACEPTHPAAVAFRTAGGEADEAHLWWRSPIPPGRGLGFSGAARVAGAMAAGIERGLSHLDARTQAFHVAAELERHADNAAASAYGGLAVTAAGRVVRLTLPADLWVVVWWPSSEVSTDQARAALPTDVPLGDAVFNIGRTALLIAALSAGDTSVLRDATEDRLHQQRRLALSPPSAAAFDRLHQTDALAVWLSGSGPTVAALVRADDAERVGADVDEKMGGSGVARVLHVDLQGVRVES